MRIGIDAREIEDGVFTGIGRALYGLIRYAEAHMASEDSLILFSAKSLPCALSGRVVNHVMPEKVRFWWDQVQLASAIRRENIDVLYSPYYKIPLMASCRKVSAVFDLIYLEYPGSSRELSLFSRMYYMIMGRWFAHASDKVLTCSQFSCNDIMRVYGVKKDRISVIPLAVAACYYPETDQARIGAVKEKFGISGRYVLYAGNFKPHKNVPALVEAFRVLALKYTGLELVLVGPRTSGYDALAAQCRCAGLEGRVIFTGKVSDEQTSRLLYAGAEVFVMPSLYEGFGLPPVEAMACAVPVVCSKATSLPEVVGHAGLCVDAACPDEIAASVGRILDDQVLRAGLLVRGLRQAAKFNEGTVMARVWSLLKEVVA